MKKSLSFLLALIMLISCVSWVTFGADGIDVYISVAENGGFVNDKNGQQVMMKKITVTNENPTIKDAFVKLHEECYEGGKDAGYATEESQYGTSVTKFWGIESFAIGYYKNHNWANGLDDPISNGDYICFWFYQDTETYLDQYLKFNNINITALEDEEIELILTNDSGIAVANATVICDGMPTENITDEQGKATISFSETGEYIISATVENGKIIPPVCTITVGECENVQATIDSDYELLSVTEVANENLVLPSTGASGKTLIEWKNENNEIITEVIKGDVDKVVTLTAKISYQNHDYYREKSFNITVPKQKTLQEIREETVLLNISQSYVSSDEWKLMDMMAYEALNEETESNVSDSVKQKYINQTIPKINSQATETELAKAIIILTSIGTDCTKLYPVNSNTPVNAAQKLLEINENSTSAWVAPYVIMALSQKDYGAEEKINSLINSILSNQNDDGSWSEYGDSVQTTSNMIACLSKYYNDEEVAVKEALDKAVVYLSSAQKADGTYDAYGYGDDTNTTAMVVIALSALGINPDTDERFIKNDVSVYDTLYKYVLEDMSGFGYNDSTFNDYSTEQAFRAIISAKAVMDSGNPYNVYDFSYKELEAGRATGSGTVALPSEPDTENTINVKITIKGKMSYWVNNKTISLKEGSTIYHALVKACEQYGVDCEGAEDGYVYKMAKNGEVLQEFDDGANSGWLYKLNNEVVNIGIMDCELSNNDKIVWFYTEDWTKVSGITIVNNDDGKATYRTVKKAISNLKEITLESEEEINKIFKDYESLSDSDKKKVTNYEELVQAKEQLEKLKAESEKVINFNDVKSHWSKTSIEYVAKKGYMAGTSENKFEPEKALTRAMLISILYRMAGEPEINENEIIEFKDAEKDSYYYKSLVWAWGEKIVKGTGNNLLNPNRNITREEFVSMVHRFVGGETEESFLTKFEDSSKISSWAVDSINWAVNSGIIVGKEGNKIAPSHIITRGEAAAIIERTENIN